MASSATLPEAVTHLHISGAEAWLGRRPVFPIPLLPTPYTLTDDHRLPIDPFTVVKLKLDQQKHFAYNDALVQSPRGRQRARAS